MLKDDRMMGMLTFVVIMIAVGTMVQRLDFFQRLFGSEGPAAVLNADVAEVRATEPLQVDVLANDTGVDDPGKLAITMPPRCGRASVRDGEIHYLGTMGCVGVQTVRYGLSGGEQTADLRITVMAPDRAGKPPAAEENRSPERVAAAPTASSSGASSSAASSGSGTAPARSGTASPPAEPAGTSAGRAAAGSAEPAAGAAATSGSTPPAAGTEIARAAPGSESSANRGGTDRNAAAARPGRECALPPTLTLALGPGAMTGVEVDAPCHARTVATLAYDGLSFAIPLDVRGSGSLEVPGFQRSTEATIAFRRGEPMQFNLPFEGIERVERVAIAWEGPSGLALNAFEFGARPGSGGHVTPSEPRSFEAVRREGGGWLETYRPERGQGQRIDVYSFWRRHAGPAGVVRLALDSVGETGEDAAAGACRGTAGGTAGGTDYVVLRSVGGSLERSRLGRVAPIDCTVLATGPARYIENAVDDLIVRRN